MADNRNCEQCGAEFAPRREHARFCSARCRVAWNREHAADPGAEISALEWSITAMGDITEQLPRVRAWDRPRGLAAISDAVWWVTIVDGTLVRYHPDLYEAVLTAEPPDQRALIEDTLAGLRFVRNQMGQDIDHVDFVRPEPNRDHRRGARVTAWTWKSVPEPVCASLSARGHDWEMTRHRAYQAQLAGHTVGEIFGRAAVFLKLVAAAVPAAAPDGQHAATGPASDGIRHVQRAR